MPGGDAGGGGGGGDGATTAVTLEVVSPLCSSMPTAIETLSNSSWALKLAGIVAGVTDAPFFAVTIRIWNVNSFWRHEKEGEGLLKLLFFFLFHRIAAATFDIEEHISRRRFRSCYIEDIRQQATSQKPANK